MSHSFFKLENTGGLFDPAAVGVPYLDYQPVIAGEKHPGVYCKIFSCRPCKRFRHPFETMVQAGGGPVLIQALIFHGSSGEFTHLFGFVLDTCHVHLFRVAAQPARVRLKVV